MCKGRGGEKYFQNMSVQLHDKAAASFRNFAFWIFILISAGFHDLHILIHYSCC